MNYLYEYLVFLGQAITILIVLLIFIGARSSQKSKIGLEQKGSLEVKKINELLRSLKKGMEETVLEPSVLKKQIKLEKSLEKKREKRSKGKSSKSELKDEQRKRIYTMDFLGDMQASGLKKLAMEITAVLTLAQKNDEIVICVESGGGLVHSYGLAASQLRRIKEKGLDLTVCVDKVAASGGYLMAAVANRILAAPFAVVGSIGVVAQIPNLHRWLKKHDVDVDVLTSGKYKRTLTLLGENDEEGREKFLSELAETHALFKDFVEEHRPALDLEKVSTGETWYGRQAIDLKLVDELITSDQYLYDACDESDVYRVKWAEHKRPIERFLSSLTTRVEGFFSALRGR